MIIKKNRKIIKMKELIGLIIAWFGGVIMVVSFWVWLGTLLLWKIFTVVGAAGIIYPAFWIMLVGVVAWLIGIVTMFIGNK